MSSAFLKIVPILLLGLGERPLKLGDSHMRRHLVSGRSVIKQTAPLVAGGF